MDEKITTYSPDVAEQTPLPVEADTSGFEDVLEDDGIINTKINEKVIIQRIARDLYKNATSGLRELYNNSARACRVAKAKHGEQKPLIKILMNEEDRKLIISDNGLGVSKERFKKVLLELGTSDNLEAGEVGQFGMGFASYMTLSSVVTIDTRARNGDQYRMLAKDGMSFQPIGDCQAKGYGTTLTMTVYETVNFAELVEQLAKIAKYSGVPTKLELEGFDYYPEGFKQGDNTIRQSSFNKDVETSKTANTDLVEIETDDFHLIALVAGDNGITNHDHIHLLNVPIDSEISMPFRWWVLNIKDERKFKPMPDRDRMTEESDKKLEGLLDMEIKKYFTNLSVLNYQEFLDSNRKNEFLWLCNHHDYAPTSMRTIAQNILDCTVRKVVYDTKVFDDGSLVYKLAENPKIIYQGYKNRNVTIKIRELEENTLLITTKKTKKIDWKKSVRFMEEFGIPSARQIMLDHKIKIPKNDKLELELVGHTHVSYYEHDLLDLDDIDENVIRVDTVPMNDVTRYIKHFKNPYTFVRNASELDEYECRDYSEWLKEIPNIMCATNHGAISIKELAEANEEVIFCEDFVDEYHNFFNGENRIVVYGTNQMIAFAFHLNPECATEGLSQDIPNPVKSKDFSDFLHDKNNFSLSSVEDKKFFCDNILDIPECFHELFGNLIRQTSWEGNDSRKTEALSQFVEYVKELGKFDGDDKIAKLAFYDYESHQIHSNLNNAEEKILEKVLDQLSRQTKYDIYDDDDLIQRLMKELILPKVFGHIELRSIIDQVVSYQKCYEVSLATHDTEFEFNDGLILYGFSLKFTGCKMKINKGYCSVKVLVTIAQ